MKDQPVIARRAHGVLAGILDIAVYDQRIASNVSRGVSLPRKPEPKKVYFTPQQLQALADAAGSRKLIVLTLGTVGLRWGELAGLQARDVLVDRRRLHVRRAVTWQGGQFTVGPLKGHESRVVTAPAIVFDSLVAKARELPLEGWLFGDNAKGRPLSGSSSARWFKTAVKNCRTAKTIPETITPHGLRHVAAGLLVGAGASVKAVQRQLGHKSAAMTLDVYSDLFDGDLDEVCAALDTLFPGKRG
ncbi:site-specific integrase [Corynebacterium aquilae]